MKGFRHVQVNLSTQQQARKVILDLRQGEVRVFLPRLELHEHVDVALGPEVVAENGPEQGQPADVALPTERGDPLEVSRCVRGS